MTYRTKYSSYGALFGLCFPIIATPLSAWIDYGNISFDSLIHSQLNNPLLWMIDSAPFFLGLFAYFGGVQYDKLLASNNEKQKLYDLLENKNADLESEVANRTAQLELNIEKLIEANQIRTDFIATVSHELRTPLTAIGGAIKLIKSNTMGNIEKQGMDLIELADRNANILTCLVNDILDIEKLEAGKLELDQESLPLHKLINQAININQPYADTFQVKLLFDEQDSDIHISIDKRRFLQVMSNVISNACKFSPSGSSINIYTSYSNNIARINIEDQGPGIPPELEETLFDKFTQADSSSTRAKGGTGLGLNIAKSLVNSMGGKIGFHANQDQGTIFYVEFPEDNSHINKQNNATG